MSEVIIWKDWIMKQVVTKFDSLKIDNGGDTVMCSDAIYYHTTYSKLIKLSLLYNVIDCNASSVVSRRAFLSKFNNKQLKLLSLQQ